jgi:hypothetical protein
MIIVSSGLSGESVEVESWQLKSPLIQRNNPIDHEPQFNSQIMAGMNLAHFFILLRRIVNDFHINHSFITKNVARCAGIQKRSLPRMTDD